MEDPLDNLEVAKLAAVMSGQLRRIDKETESSVPANRIDLRKFQQQVVNSANPNAARPVDFGGYQNQDEARMMEFLNREALSKIPELIPPPVYTPPPQHNIPVVSQEVQSIPVQASVPIVQPQQQIKIESNDELIQTIKSIDNSLKELCDFFITSNNKKIKKPDTLKKTKKKITKNIVTDQPLNPLSKEKEMELLEEIMTHQKNLQNVE